MLLTTEPSQLTKPIFSGGDTRIFSSLLLSQRTWSRTAHPGFLQPLVVLTSRPQENLSSHTLPVISPSGEHTGQGNPELL